MSYRKLLAVALLPVLFLSALLLFPQATKAAGPAYPGVEVYSLPAYPLLNITGADNNVVKTSPGNLVRLTINSVTTSGTITVYDNTVCAGTKIATITAPFVGMSLPYGGAFNYGLCINTGSSTNMDLTVTYR